MHSKSIFLSVNCIPSSLLFPGTGWGAVLIAGNDDQSVDDAQALSKEVKNMAEILKSKSLPVMCLK